MKPSWFSFSHSHQREAPMMMGDLPVQTEKKTSGSELIYLVILCSLTSHYLIQTSKTASSIFTGPFDLQRIALKNRHQRHQKKQFHPSMPSKCLACSPRCVVGQMHLKETKTWRCSLCSSFDSHDLVWKWVLYNTGHVSIFNPSVLHDGWKETFSYHPGVKSFFEKFQSRLRYAIHEGVDLMAIDGVKSCNPGKSNEPWRTDPIPSYWLANG